MTESKNLSSHLAPSVAYTQKLYTYTHVFMKITQSGPILFCDL